MMHVYFNFMTCDYKFEINKDDNIKDICRKFEAAHQINSEKSIYLYEGEVLDLEKKFKDYIKNNNEMRILVQDMTTIFINKKIVPNEIICPKCFESCRIKIKDYKIKLYECKNNHEKNLFLEEFDQSQYINELCSIDNCKANINEKYKNEFYTCLKCKKNLCPLCKSSHAKIHDNIIDYKKKNYTCFVHKCPFISYCNECKISLCLECEKEKKHKNHKIIKFESIPLDENEIKVFKDKVDKFNEKIEEIIKILNETKGSIEIYYSIIDNILKKYQSENSNYQILQNISDIKNNINIKEIEDIINDNDFNSVYINILNLYNKIKGNNFHFIYEKKENDNYNDKNIDIDKSKNHNIKKNEKITLYELKYKIKEKDTKIKIFGKNFVKNNKDKCKIICQNKSYDLSEYFDLSDYDKNKDILTIKLKGINNISNMSYMFNKCLSLDSLSDISYLNMKNVTNISFMFSNCSQLTSLPDISKWNTENINDMNSIFSGCSSLISLPDISKWNTQKVTNMSWMFKNCSSLTSLPDISMWNTDKLTNMESLFENCLSLKSLPDISNWNTKSIENMGMMFYNCSALESLPDISKWKTNNVSNMNGIFCGCLALKTLPDISVWNVDNVIDLSNIFLNCESLEHLPEISNWKVNDIAKMDNMFTFCKETLNIPPNFKR